MHLEVILDGNQGVIVDGPYPRLVPSWKAEMVRKSANSSQIEARVSLRRFAVCSVHVLGCMAKVLL